MSTWKKNLIKLRKNQEEILSYTGGKLGISAVPGSGKTWTLSLLAADLISRGILEDGQEILIVTLVNSAVNNFYSRVSQFIREFRMIPYLGYRVRTLHGLAHDILRERPDLVGLSDDFIIIDERETESIRKSVVNSWLMTNSVEIDTLLNEGIEEYKRQKLMHTSVPDLLQNVCNNCIRYAKDQQLSPQIFKSKLDQYSIHLPMLYMIYEMYEEYQKALRFRGGIDYDDLISYALQALTSDEGYLDRLKFKWPYILEDEAQDSSYLQQRILETLTGETGNWVRVGDPNQAIFDTFTTADPKYLIDYINQTDVVSQELPVSGRSVKKIIDLANYFAGWTSNNHPNENVRSALSAEPLICPTLGDDPQPNPSATEAKVHISLSSKYEPKEEIHQVIGSVERWLIKNQDSTVAILVPRNDRGNHVVDELHRRNIPYCDSLLRSTSRTRSSALFLSKLLNYLADPKSSQRLSDLFGVWVEHQDIVELTESDISILADWLQNISTVEQLIYPADENKWIGELYDTGTSIHVVELLDEFVKLVALWVEASFLPVDQLIILVSQDIFIVPSDLALSYKIASLLKMAKASNTSWGLSECACELQLIANNERKYLGFSDDDLGFDPERHRGTVVVATVHKAKGLEWDRVYLMSANNYSFPSGDENDRYITEKWFIRNRLDIQAEILSQLKAVIDPYDFSLPIEGNATHEAKMDYVRERLRLLYVGITRAKKHLIITWNTGRNNDSQPAVPLFALYRFLENYETNLEEY